MSFGERFASGVAAQRVLRFGLANCRAGNATARGGGHYDNSALRGFRGDHPGFAYGFYGAPADPLIFASAKARIYTMRVISFSFFSRVVASSALRMRELTRRVEEASARTKI